MNYIPLSAFSEETRTTGERGVAYDCGVILRKGKGHPCHIDKQ